ncbi:MAG: Hsp20/alpha crystallin family protein [Lentisphaerae bacterium]|nr:Hsp20/alpha crystallin family protein [Lentisphaerota bacterium]MCP4101002.1 Hsp20/alpha crystallin family protein [Lentisphaerota bacterium]
MAESKKEAKTIEYVDFAPPADVIEDNTGIKLVLDVPGSCSECLDIDVEDRVLKITAGTDVVRCDKTVRYKRSFQISDQIAVNKIKAKVVDGILTLDLPKTDHAKVHKIKIHTD